jgi:hypothetical protein
MALKRIGKNRRNLIDQIFDLGKDFQGYDYSEMSSGDSQFKTTKDLVKSELYKWDFAYFTVDLDTGRCDVHVTSNNYYWFHVPVGKLKELIEKTTGGQAHYHPRKGLKEKSRYIVRYGKNTDVIWTTEHYYKSLAAAKRFMEEIRKDVDFVELIDKTKTGENKAKPGHALTNLVWHMKHYAIPNNSFPSKKIQDAYLDFQALMRNDVLYKNFKVEGAEIGKFKDVEKPIYQYHKADPTRSCLDDKQREAFNRLITLLQETNEKRNKSNLNRIIIKGLSKDKKYYEIEYPTKGTKARLYLTDDVVDSKTERVGILYFLDTAVALQKNVNYNKKTGMAFMTGLSTNVFPKPKQATKIKDLIEKGYA